MVQYNLTRGSIETIMAGENCDRPIVQVLGQKKIAGNPSASTSDRYRLLLSDGEHSLSSCMLATQLNEKVLSGELEMFSVVRLDKYLCNLIPPDRRVMILLEVTLLHPASDVKVKLGNPQALRPSGSSDQNGAPDKAQHAAPVPASSSGQSSYGGANANLLPRPMATTNMSNITSNFRQATSVSSSTSPATKTFYGNSTAANSGKQELNKPYGAGAAAPSSKPFQQSMNASTQGDTPMKVHPIASLTPYQNRWTIKARVSQKSAIKTWSNSRGEGQLFSMSFLDESGEIRATAFKAEVDKFFNLIEVNKVYYVRKAMLKTANKQFSTINNDYEMTFSAETEVIPCDDDAGDLPSVTFSFVPINQLEQHEPNTFIDVIGIVKDVQEVKTIVAKATQKEIKKRDIVLVDESQVQINLTLWGNEAETFNGSGRPILAIKGARLSDWGGRSLGTVANSQIMLNPDIPESHQLRGWFDSVGHTADYSEYRRQGDASGGGSTTNWKALGEVKAQNLGVDKVDYFNVKGIVGHLKKDNCMYQACATTDCQKKVIDQGNGMFRCEKCQKEQPAFKWRMILQMNVVDHSGDLWVTCFQDTAEIILNKKADDIGYLKDNSPSEFDMLFSESGYKSYIFKCRAKMETFNDETRLKTICLSATPVNYQEYNRKLLADIDACLALAS